MRDAAVQAEVRPVMQEASVQVALRRRHRDAETQTDFEPAVCVRRRAAAWSGCSSVSSEELPPAEADEDTWGWSGGELVLFAAGVASERLEECGRPPTRVPPKGKAPSKNRAFRDVRVKQELAKRREVAKYTPEEHRQLRAWGVVTEYNPSSEHGFLRDWEQTKWVFFHRSSIVWDDPTGELEISPGDPFYFSRMSGPRGPWAAAMCRPGEPGGLKPVVSK